MSRQPVAVRPRAAITQQIPPQQKLPLSAFIRRQLVTVADRDQARGRLVSILILAVALLTAGTIPGYVNTASGTISLVIIGLALAVYVVALITNGVLRRTATAAYILVFGGGVALAALPVSLAISGDALQAAHASLLLPAIILIAGLLFVPEVTLLVAFGATACTAFAQLYGLSVDHRMDRHDAYLAVVYTLGLQLLAGLVAWLLSQFIYESAVESQQAQEMQFAQARLDAMLAKIDEDELRLQQAISALQLAVTHAMAGDYGARAEIADGPLASLGDNLNLLLQRYEAATQVERRQLRIDAAALPLIDSLSRMAESGTPTPTSLPVMTNTPLDSVSVVLTQMHATFSQRIGSIQRLVGEVAEVASHAKEPLTGAAEKVQDAQGIAGKLLSGAESALKAAQQQISALQTIRRMLSALLPPEITMVGSAQDAHRDAAGLTPTDAAALLGLGEDLGINTPGYTGVFDVFEAQGAAEGVTGISPLTVPLPAISLDDERGEAAGETKVGEKKRGKKAGEPPQELIETWNLATQGEREVGQFERTLRGIIRDLGYQTGSLRDADANIAWLGNAREAIATNAERLQQLAGAGLPAFGAAGDNGPASSSRPLPQGRQGPAQAAPPPTFGQPSATSGPQQGTPFSWPPAAEGADDGTLAELARDAAAPGQQPPPSPQGPSGETPAPGSLRASDLISLDDIQSIFGPLDEPPAE